MQRSKTNLQTKRWSPALLATVLALPLLMQLPTAAQNADLDKALKKVAADNKALAKSQDRIQELSDETSQLISSYRNTERRIEALGVYNNQLNTLLRSQEQEIESLRKQIDTFTIVGRQITPLMLKMIDSLERFIELDVPFLLEERKKRVGELRKLMDRADVEDSEKFRRLVEAYQIENDYGRTIEAYRGPLDLDGAKKTVDFLRIGRVTLVYISLGGKESGMWDKAAEAWKPLPDEYKTSLPAALRIARRQAAPDLIRLPVPAPEKL